MCFGPGRAEGTALRLTIRQAELDPGAAASRGPSYCKIQQRVKKTSSAT